MSERPDVVLDILTLECSMAVVLIIFLDDGQSGPKHVKFQALCLNG
jgi:hypothetical protein